MLMHEATKVDQATGLRRMGALRPVKVIAVSGGKGGVGKTNVSVNLAVALAQLGRKVMLLDADFGLANVDVLLGLSPEYDLSHLIRGERNLEEIIVEGPGDIRIIPASSGVGQMASLSPAEHAGVIRAFSELGYDLDVLIVDTAAGISDSVVSFCRASREVIVVVCDEPATFLGAIPHDERLRKAVQKQQAVVEAYPSSPSATALKKIARSIDEWPLARQAGGQLEFFVERLIEAEREHVEALS
jgi:flagellar biosynthesis protein FlhG